MSSILICKMDQPIPVQGTINLKPHKPEVYDGKRDFLTVNSWRFNIENFLELTQLRPPGTPISDENKSFSASFLREIAAVWWPSLVSSGVALLTWTDFKKDVTREFVPADYVKCARYLLDKLKPFKTMNKFLARFRNVALTIPGISNEETGDGFIDGRKREIRVEDLNCKPTPRRICASRSKHR